MLNPSKSRHFGTSREHLNEQMWVRTFNSYLFLVNLAFIMRVHNFWLWKMSDCLLFLYIADISYKINTFNGNLLDWTVCSVPERWFILRRRDDRVVEGFVRILNVPIDLSRIRTRCDTIRIFLINWYTSRPVGWSRNILCTQNHPEL